MGVSKRKIQFKQLVVKVLKNVKFIFFLMFQPALKGTMQSDGT